MTEMMIEDADLIFASIISIHPTPGIDDGTFIARAIISLLVIAIIARKAWTWLKRAGAVGPDHNRTEDPND